MQIANRLHRSRALSSIFRTLDYELERELTDCDSVLDLGCGPASPVSRFRSRLPNMRTVGVEAFEPYVHRAREIATHDEIIESTIQDLTFADKSYDAVILIDVLEHIDEAAALDVLKLAEQWARKKVILSSPNGFIAQKALDGNPLQAHLSGWTVNDLLPLGYRSRGMAGLKWLRREVQDETMGEDILTSIRFRPRLLWFAISAASQPFTYRLPRLAFSLFSVKSL